MDCDITGPDQAALSLTPRTLLKLQQQHVDSPTVVDSPDLMDIFFTPDAHAEPGSGLRNSSASTADAAFFTPSGTTSALASSGGPRMAPSLQGTTADCNRRFSFSMPDGAQPDGSHAATHAQLSAVPCMTGVSMLVLHAAGGSPMLLDLQPPPSPAPAAIAAEHSEHTTGRPLPPPTGAPADAASTPHAPPHVAVEEGPGSTCSRASSIQDVKRAACRALEAARRCSDAAARAREAAAAVQQHKGEEAGVAGEGVQGQQQQQQQQQHQREQQQREQQQVAVEPHSRAEVAAVTLQADAAAAPMKPQLVPPLRLDSTVPPLPLTGTGDPPAAGARGVVEMQAQQHRHQQQQQQHARSYSASSRQARAAQVEPSPRPSSGGLSQRVRDGAGAGGGSVTARHHRAPAPAAPATRLSLPSGQAHCLTARAPRSAAPEPPRALSRMKHGSYSVAAAAGKAGGVGVPTCEGKGMVTRRAVKPALERGTTGNSQEAARRTYAPESVPAVSSQVLGPRPTAGTGSLPPSPKPPAAEARRPAWGYPSQPPMSARGPAVPAAAARRPGGVGTGGDTSARTATAVARALSSRPNASAFVPQAVGAGGRAKEAEGTPTSSAVPRSGGGGGAAAAGAAAATPAKRGPHARLTLAVESPTCHSPAAGGPRRPRPSCSGSPVKRHDAGGAARGAAAAVADTPTSHTPTSIFRGSAETGAMSGCSPAAARPPRPASRLQGCSTAAAAGGSGADKTKLLLLAPSSPSCIVRQVLPAQQEAPAAVAASPAANRYAEPRAAQQPARERQASGTARRTVPGQGVVPDSVQAPAQRTVRPAVRAIVTAAVPLMRQPPGPAPATGRPGILRRLSAPGSKPATAATAAATAAARPVSGPPRGPSGDPCVRLHQQQLRLDEQLACQEAVQSKAVQAETARAEVAELPSTPRGAALDGAAGAARAMSKAPWSLLFDSTPASSIAAFPAGLAAGGHPASALPQGRQQLQHTPAHDITDGADVQDLVASWNSGLPQPRRCPSPDGQKDRTPGTAAPPGVVGALLDIGATPGSAARSSAIRRSLGRIDVSQFRPDGFNESLIF